MAARCPWPIPRSRPFPNCLPRSDAVSAPASFDPKQAYVASQWPYDRPLDTCRFDPQGRFVFCGAEDSNLIRFNLADGAHVNFSGGHDTWVQAIGFSKDAA